MRAWYNRHYLMGDEVIHVRARNFPGQANGAKSSPACRQNEQH